MLASSAVYKQAIHGPHQQGVWRVDLYDGVGGPLLASRVPVLSGSISANLTHRVTRAGSFSVDSSWWPGTDPTAPLSPYHTVAQIRAGIRYGDGSEELFPVFTGRVGDVTLEATGQVTASVEDLAAEVIDAHFEQPRVSDNVTILAQIQRLISEVIPGSVLGPTDVTNPAALTPPLAWDEDRGKALDDLAEALGGRWYYLGDGTPVVRRFPYDTGTVVQTIQDGPGGLLVTGTPVLSRRDGTANSITVAVERFDGGTPFRVTARDTTPGSPTLYGGPFGKVSRVIKVQTPLTESEATVYARAQLNASTALASRWSVQMVPDYTLEPGDTVRFGARGVKSTELIDAITYPLGPGMMALTTRSFVRAQATLN